MIRTRLIHLYQSNYALAEDVGGVRVVIPVPRRGVPHKQNDDPIVRVFMRKTSAVFKFKVETTDIALGLAERIAYDVNAEIERVEKLEVGRG